MKTGIRLYVPAEYFAPVCGGQMKGWKIEGCPPALVYRNPDSADVVYEAEKLARVRSGGPLSCVFATVFIPGQQILDLPPYHDDFSHYSCGDKPSDVFYKPGIVNGGPIACLYKGIDKYCECYRQRNQDSNLVKMNDIPDAVIDLWTGNPDGDYPDPYESPYDRLVKSLIREASDGLGWKLTTKIEEDPRLNFDPNCIADFALIA